MAKRTGPTSLTLKLLLIDLSKLYKKEKVNLWKRLEYELSKSSRNRREINLYKIDQYARDGETVVVPGKVLSEGELNHKVNVAAWKFSGKAKEKINKKGKAISIKELIKENPKGKRVRIIG